MGAMKPRRPELESMLGAVSSPVLHCPQGAQRGLLRLGHAPDARDIESLVGAILPQRLELLATLEVPERNDPVIPATGQHAPIGTHPERLNGLLLRSPHPH